MNKINNLIVDGQYRVFYTQDGIRVTQQLDSFIEFLKDECKRANMHHFGYNGE
jgi:hypothetical protein